MATGLAGEGDATLAANWIILEGFGGSFVEIDPQLKQMPVAVASAHLLCFKFRPQR